MRATKAAGALIIIPCSALCLAAFYVFMQLFVPVADLKGPVDVMVDKGMSFRQAAGLFSAQGLIRDVNVFSALGRAAGIHKKLRPGYYRFEGGVRPIDVYYALRDGRIIRWEITVVEGETLEDIRRKLLSKGVMAGGDFDGLVKDKAFSSLMGISAPSFEGYLFPDTYSIPKGTEPKEVLGMMVRRLREMFDDELTGKMRSMGFDERRLLTLASIIEKEARVDSERPVVSAVYHNRLRRGMPLQADPTAIYGVKSQREGITKKDLLRRTDYNTYVIKGLPPGPIASPGFASIRAALYPANVPYVFFVSNNDGTHTFSATFEEHKRAVELYRAKKSVSNAASSSPSSADSDKIH